MINVTSPSTKEEFKAYYALRYKVLNEPWGHPRGTEKDDYEAISEHFMAVEGETGTLLGVVKLFERSAGVGQISHLAVDPKHQRQGIGSLLLEAIEGRARERGFGVLGATTHATGTAYFEKHGYRVAGVQPAHLGIAHLVWMEKELL